MGIDTTELDAERAEFGKSVSAAAEAYAKAKVQAIKESQPLRAKMSGLSDSIESPIDYNRSQIKQMPLSADGLRMNVQYFSKDSNSQDSGTHASNVAKFISGQIGHLGSSFSAEASRSSASQVHSQTQNHSITGTLVIAITCTHKDAVLLAPLILDVDKGIRAFNAYFPDDMIKTDSPANIQEIATRAETKDEKALTILSGATMGSCFIGMVHILNATDTRSSEAMESVASSLQTQMKVGSWFKSASGGFGVSKSFSDDAKSLLSSQNITSHCTLTTIGSIPSIKSNQVKMGVREFSDSDGSASMTALLKLQGVTQSDQQSVASSASAARTGQNLVALKSGQMESALSALKDIDDGANKIIDINSMMDALDDYVQKCLDGKLGAPITYYLKRITASQLAQGWIAKYYPGKYLSVSIDDAGPATPPAVSPPDSGSAAPAEGGS
ncbi:hypothetical protein WQ56_03320 [Luteimonas sp. FCS-9]|nr:hypothetical protein WQ56_03320 [Luteimonas sp. FCS-9]